MKKAIFLVLVLISLFLLTIRFGLNPILEKSGIKARAGLKIISTPEAGVSIEGKEAGTTPYEDSSLAVGEYMVRLSAGKAEWQGRVKLTPGTVTVVNRELGESLASSSGEVLFLSSGKGAVITSTPAGAEVEVDGIKSGQTPLILTDLPAGEHTFVLSREGYLKRSIRAAVPPNLTLNLDVALAISEVSLDSLPTLPAADPVVKLTVKQTPVGFLRLRDKPSTVGREIGRLSVGDTLTLVEELGSWDKVRTVEGLEGYVSVSYVQKIP